MLLADQSSVSKTLMSSGRDQLSQGNKKIEYIAFRIRALYKGTPTKCLTIGELIDRREQGEACEQKQAKKKAQREREREKKKIEAREQNAL